jgi:hypothetical protein
MGQLYLYLYLPFSQKFRCKIIGQDRKENCGEVVGQGMSGNAKKCLPFHS